MRRYFEEEMRYLHEAGKAYAEVHPDTARYLNIDSVSDRDPYVERLFEGFAFLAGRVHERIDSEMPVYTEALCSLLYPHLLRPIPSLTMVELKPRRGLIRATTSIERGTEVRSGPVGDERTICRFRTTQEVRAQPVQLSGANLSWGGDGTSSVRLEFSLEKGSDLQNVRLSPLRIHFLADSATSSTMHLYFTRYAREVRVSVEGRSDAVRLSAQEAIRPGGFEDDEGLLPYAPNVPQGMRLIQEYLCFRRKFWCIDLLELDRLSLDDQTSRFAVDVRFDHAYPENRHFSIDNLRLFCSPAVNLFKTDAEPIRVEHFTSEYHVRASARHRSGVEVYEIDGVVGLEDATARRHTYSPYFAFRAASGNGHGRHYIARRRMGPLDRLETYIALTGDALEDPERLTPETLSITATCTNGSLPRQRLQEGDVDRLAPEAPQLVDVRNLVQPTLNLEPPADTHPDFFWQLVSHWSFNYLSVADRSALLGIMSLYDWTRSEASKRQLSGISGVAWKAAEMPYRGAVIRGAEVQLTVQDGHFEDGELNLFGLVLSRFLTMYATINSFVQLKATLMPSGAEFEWKPQLGTTPIV